MQIETVSTNAASKAFTLTVAEPTFKPFNKEAHAKSCKHRTATGFCTRSSRTCPATLFTLTFNN